MAHSVASARNPLREEVWSKARKVPAPRGDPTSGSFPAVRRCIPGAAAGSLRRSARTR